MEAVRTSEPAPAKKAAPKPSGTLRERYDAMAQTFAQDRTGTHAVQIAIVCEPSNVEKALRSGGSRVWFLPMSFRGRSCYRVFYGRFNNEAAAQSALGDVPQDLRDSTPTVVRIPR
jgi:septal ring-binding cell division protein DamX